MRAEHEALQKSIAALQGIEAWRQETLGLEKVGPGGRGPGGVQGTALLQSSTLHMSCWLSEGDSCPAALCSCCSLPLLRMTHRTSRPPSRPLSSPTPSGPQLGGGGRGRRRRAPAGQRAGGRDPAAPGGRGAAAGGAAARGGRAAAGHGEQGGGDHGSGAERAAAPGAAAQLRARLERAPPAQPSSFYPSTHRTFLFLPYPHKKTTRRPTSWRPTTTAPRPWPPSSRP